MKNTEKKVDLFIPRTPGDGDPNALVSVNGKNYLLPKGKTSKVPESVAYEFRRSQRAQNYSEEHIERLIAENAEKQAQSIAEAKKKAGG